MTEQKKGTETVPGGMFLGLMVIEVGIVLVLVAQSFSSPSRQVILGGGGLLLLGGAVLFILVRTLKRTVPRDHDVDE